MQIYNNKKSVTSFGFDRGHWEMYCAGIEKMNNMVLKNPLNKSYEKIAFIKLD